MVCFGYVIVHTVHTGDNKDNNNIIIIIFIRLLSQQPRGPAVETAPTVCNTTNTVKALKDESTIYTGV